MTRHCSETGCHRPVLARGWCNAHYKRFWRNGLDPLEERAVRPIEERFWEKVEKTDDCWLWLGCTRNGYGSFNVRMRSGYAHRWAYEHLVGPIAAGFELDHLCRNPLCVNPAHLDPVLHRTNVLRGESPAAANARKTHCIRGHEFTDENTYIVEATGSRMCRQCIPERLQAAAA